MTQFRMDQIKVEQFAILEDKLPQNDIDFSAELTHGASKEDKVLAIRLKVSYTSDEKLLLVCVVSCEFKIEPNSWQEWVKDNQVIIDKGYMNIDDLLVRIEKLKNELHSDLTDNAIVFHFRIGTAGKNDKETTHPFIITNQDDKLRATKITSNLGVVHNGIIYHYSYKGGILSDTQLFIKNVIYPISKLNKNF